eukprot:TRINITY_DN2495_c0_g1_i9.p1 TRINITY_DN2495_c0_g1~~TRINITY_DN2495_c0_g1_i9.p1  ORF type:complete len:250 (+),score=11.01 TRINITY_DN2495_c0_g1_i9:370-1119(+)
MGEVAMAVVGDMEDIATEVVVVMGGEDMVVMVGTEREDLLDLGVYLELIFTMLNYSSPPKNTDYRCTVENMPPGCSWQDLKDHFRQAGDVCFADIRRGRDGVEFGVVEFKHEDDLLYACKHLDKSRLRGCTLRVYNEYKGDRSRQRSRTRSGSRGRRSSSRGKRSTSRKRSPSAGRSNSQKRSPTPRRDSPARSASPKRSRSPIQNDSVPGSPKLSPNHESPPRKPRSPSPRNGSVEGSRSPRSVSRSR